MKTEKRRLGDLGEDIACNYLEEEGYIIVERNYLKKWGEIDIIAKKRGVLHFVEVKTVSREIGLKREGYRAEENVHQGKLRKIARTIQTYLAGKRDQEFIFDVIAVYLDPITHQSEILFLQNIIIEVY